MNKRRTLILFIILSLANGIIFYFRDWFQYIPRASYESLYKECTGSCKEDWRTFIEPYPANELQEAKQISDGWIGRDATTTLAKVQRISQMIHHQFQARNGEPSAAFLTLSPLQQYKTLNNNPKEKLWCGVYAQMMEYFCWSQQIPTRYIEIMNPGDHHVVNECYIPELKKWVLVDAMSNLAGIRDHNGNVLNLQEFRNFVKNDGLVFASNESDTARILNKNEGFIQTYYLPDNSFNYHYYTSNEYAYRPLEKLKRYFLPVSWYEIYDSHKKSNLPFVLKLVFFTLWMVSIGFLLKQLRL
jgi:hypothetical protein